MLLRTASFAMGTRFELVLGHDDARARAAAEAAIETIEVCDARYSRFRSDSLISRINREAGSAWVRVDAETFELLARCDELRRDTDGAFDVCVGTAMDRVREGSLDASTVAGAFVLDATSSSVRFTRPGTALDLGAIGKGHALDLAAALLAELGVECALLHGGTSSVIALGAPPTLPRGWRVDLGADFCGTIAHLRHASLSLSAVRPNRGAVAMRSARDAEAWSTALLVLAAREGALEQELSRLALPRDFECVLSDPVDGTFAHAAQDFDALCFLPSQASLHTR
jgi:thiamine biosynthesis lipoprotein